MGCTTTNRFSREVFGGGDAGEALAHDALLAHEATLVPGTRVRVYRQAHEGLTGTVVAGDAPGSRCVYVRDADGLDWAVETRNLEVLP